jgi:hypothetical protein
LCAQVQLSQRDTVDLLRSLGGLLFAIGAMVLLSRKPGHHEWDHFGRFLIVLMPTVVLYVLALGEPKRSQSQDPRPWQSPLAVTAILLVPVTLFEFLVWVGANTADALYGAGVFAITALLASYAARRARASYAALLAGLSVLLAWLFVWEKIFDHPSAGTYRWLLVAGGVLLLAAAGRLARAREVGASEVATAGGIAAVAAGVLGVVVGTVVGATRSINTLLGTSSTSAGSSNSGKFGISAAKHISSEPRHVSSPGVLSSSHHTPSSFVAIHTNGLQHFGWDLYLLIVSLGLVWVGSRVHARGLGYVGGFGLLAFLISVSAQITRLESGRAPAAGVVGWPLALLIIGVLGVAAPALYRREPSSAEE